MNRLGRAMIGRYEEMKRARGALSYARALQIAAALAPSIEMEPA